MPPQPSDQLLLPRAHTPVSRTLKLLYMAHALSAFGDRLQQFGLPLLLVEAWGSATLLPAALFALCTQVLSFLLMPAVGFWVDQAPRLRIMRASIILQNGAIIGSCALLSALAVVGPLGATPTQGGKKNGQMESHVSCMTTSVTWTLPVSVCFVGILLFSAFAELMGAASTLAIERDWVVLLTAGRSDSLARVNSILRRIDLGCKVRTFHGLFTALHIFSMRLRSQRHY